MKTRYDFGAKCFNVSNTFSTVTKNVYERERRPQVSFKTNKKQIILISMIRTIMIADKDCIIIRQHSFQVFNHNNQYRKILFFYS